MHSRLSCVRLATAVLLFALYTCQVFAQAPSTMTAPQPSQTVSSVPNQMNCNRQVTAHSGNNGYLFDLRATNLCTNPNSGNMNRKAVIDFQFGSAVVPNIHIAAYKNKQDSTAAFGARLLMDRIVEYNEANNVPGYQPGQDQIVKSHDLVGRQWSKIQKSSLSGDPDQKIFSMSTTLSNSDPSFVASQIRFGAMVTEQEVVYNNNTVKTVLTPNSAKSIIELDGINYQASGNSTRLAIGLLFVVRGDVTKRNDTVTPRADGDRPYEPTNNQTVARLSDPSQSLDAGFYSWQKFVLQSLGNGLVRQSPLIESNFTIESSSGTSYTLDSQTESNFKLVRIWLALSDRVDNFVWDPSIGSAEEEVSAQDANPTAAPVSSSAGLTKQGANIMLIAAITFIFAILFQ